MHAESIRLPKVFRLTRGWKVFFYLVIPVYSNILMVALFSTFIFVLWPQGVRSFGTIGCVFLVAGVCMGYVSVFYLCLYFFVNPLRHIVTPEGITFCAFSYCIYTPWSNVKGIGLSRLNMRRPQALLFYEAAVHGRVRDGRPLERATIERRWFVNPKEVSVDAIPLLFTVPKNWQESELGAYIRHSLEDQTPMPPERGTA